jgi:hypothetical protein
MEPLHDKEELIWEKWCQDLQEDLGTTGNSGGPTSLFVCDLCSRQVVSLCLFEEQRDICYKNEGALILSMG